MSGASDLTCWVCDHIEHENERWNTPDSDEPINDFRIHRDSPVDPVEGVCAEHEYADPLPCCYGCGEEVRYFKDPDALRPPWYCDKPECQEEMEGKHPDLHRSLPDASFEQAWSVAKAPLWWEDDWERTYRSNADYEPEDYSDTHPTDDYDDLNFDRYSIIPKIRTEVLGGNPDSIDRLPRYWESKNKDARGFASFREGDAPDDPIDPYHQIRVFEMARDARGKGLMRDRLQEMIAELKEHDPEARSTHMTHSERNTAALWDRMVDEGLIDSASTKPWVTTTPEGRLIPHTKRRQG